MTDFLIRVLFESLPRLLVVCVIALAVALAVHRTRYTRASRRGIWVTLAVCVGLIILQQVVVTDREALEQTVRIMARAVDQGDVATIADYLDENFQMGEVGREEFIRSVNQTLQVYQVDEARIYGVQSDINSDAAEVKFGAYCDVRHDGQLESNLPTHWELSFVRRGQRWLLQRIVRAEWRLPIGDGRGDIIPYFR